MTAPPEKILALQFKYFGDAVLMTPALRALRRQFPRAELHLLVPEEMSPIFQQLPWISRVWALPRRRGRANLSVTRPLIAALRRERFDRSVDFASNDRGAIFSLLTGAKRRLGWAEKGGFFGRKFIYHDRVAPPVPTPHESVRLAHLLSGWQVSPPESWESEIRPEPSLADTARKILPDERAIICHVASSQFKKEWPLAHWAEFYRLAMAAGYRLVFTTARGEREAALMTEFRKLAPDAVILPAISDLALFLAVLHRAAFFISGDTGPLHFAAGLGVPTLALFGPTDPARWAPLGEKHQFLTGGICQCDGNLAVCQATQPCLAKITPQQVLNALQGKVVSR